MSWINQNILAIDIGNSRIKMLDNNLYFAFDLSYDDWLKKIEINIIDCNYHKIIISSVNEKAYKELTRLLKAKGCPFINANDHLEKSAIIDFSRIQGMGADRKLGLIGAFGNYEPPFAVVDCGTAITINVLIEPNIALGGAIFPGLRTQAKALHQFTSLLPEVEPIATSYCCGKNTIEAIQIGIFNSVVGGIREILQKVSRNKLKRKKPRVVVTGGDGAIIAENLYGFDVHLEPELVLKGLQKFAKSVNIL